MSKINASWPSSHSARGESDSKLDPYRLWTGAPVRGSRNTSSTATMYWASPRMPCSGPNSAASFTPCAAARRSARCQNRRSTLVGLTIAPTLIPRTAEKPSATQTSSPVRTAACSSSRVRREPAAEVRAAESARDMVRGRLLHSLERARRRLFGVASEEGADHPAARLVVRASLVGEALHGALRRLQPEAADLRRGRGPHLTLG